MVPVIRGLYASFDHNRWQLARAFSVRWIYGRRIDLLVAGVGGLAAIVIASGAWRAGLDHDRDETTSKQLQAALETSITLIQGLQSGAIVDLRGRSERLVGTLDRQIRAIELAERAGGELDRPELMYRRLLADWDDRVKPALKSYLGDREIPAISPDHPASSPRHSVETPPDILRSLNSLGISVAQLEFVRREHAFSDRRSFDPVLYAALVLLLMMAILVRRTSGVSEHTPARTDVEDAPIVSARDQVPVEESHGHGSARPAASLALLQTVLAGFAENPESPQAFLLLLREVECLVDAKCSAIFIIKDAGSYGVPLVCTDPTERDCFAGLLWERLPALRQNDGESIQTLFDPAREDIQIVAVQLTASDGLKKGVLLLKRQSTSPLSAAETALLNTLGEHVTAIICSAQRAELNRRIALCEERAVIARELHDSLAQSLSYLKIQTSRLQALLHSDQAKQALNHEDADAIVQELRMKLNLAYRQLRELITTFRLTMNGRGLGQALKDSIEEFEDRSSVALTLDNRLSDGLLSVDEEMHVLQIVRECVCNIVRHAQAKRAEVALYRDGFGTIRITVDDDGIGMQESNSSDMHHGLVIMQQRAHNLGGDLRVRRSPEGGTRVRVSFAPRGSSSQPEQVDSIIDRMRP